MSHPSNTAPQAGASDASRTTAEAAAANPDSTSSSEASNAATSGRIESSEGAAAASAALTGVPSAPPPYISRADPEYARMRDLWSRFRAVLTRLGADEHVQLNEPAAAQDVEAAVAEMNITDYGGWPAGYLASLACCNGQSNDSTTGAFGRWFLLDVQQSFLEWRDQRDMMLQGLYSDEKYNAARRAQPRHRRINMEYWFNQAWIPILCSRQPGTGCGDYVAIDFDPLLNAHRGQVILYLTESAERIVLANSFGEWMEAIVRDLERGVYSFDKVRKTWVAGQLPAGSEAAREEKSGGGGGAAAAIISPGGRGQASRDIGVELFLFSSTVEPERRDFFIKNKTEDLALLDANPQSDFSLLSIDDALSALFPQPTRQPESKTDG